MISLEKSLKHMAWADKTLFELLLKLPDQAWQAKLENDEWNVADHVFHLIASADWYSFELGEPIQFTSKPESIAVLRTLGTTWTEINHFLITQATKSDEKLSYIEDEKIIHVMRSTVLSQAVIHSAEHRMQISVTLKSKGFGLPELEDFSLWKFESLQSNPESAVRP